MTVLKFPSRNELTTKLLDEILVQEFELAAGPSRDELAAELARVFTPLTSLGELRISHYEPAWFASLTAQQQQDVQTFAQSIADEILVRLLAVVRDTTVRAAWTAAGERSRARDSAGVGSLDSEGPERDGKDER